MTDVKVSCTEQAEALKCERRKVTVHHGTASLCMRTSRDPQGREVLRPSHGLPEAGQSLPYSTMGQVPKCLPREQTHPSSVCTLIRWGSAGT